MNTYEKVDGYPNKMKKLPCQKQNGIITHPIIKKKTQGMGNPNKMTPSLWPVTDSIVPDDIIKNTYNITNDIRFSLKEQEQNSKVRFEYLSQELQDIKEILTNTKKVNRFILPLREPATNIIYYHLMNKKRKSNEKYIAYARFRIAITLLWATGLRVNEIRLLTLEDLENILAYKEFQIFQPKVNRYRPLLFTPKAIDQLELLNDEIQYVFSTHKYLSGEIRPDSWIAFVNKRLLQNTKGVCTNIKSHSFRINFATSLLRHAPLQKVSNLIGHQDVRTTMSYNRYIPNKKEARSFLQRAIDEDV
jgi:integrase